MKKFFAILLLFYITACSKEDVDVSYNYPNNQDYQRKSRAGGVYNNDLVVFDEVAAKKEKRNSLWKASVEVVGTLFPIAVMDEDSGIIASQWHQENPLSKKRVKVNVLLKGDETKPENLRVSVFHQVKDEAGNWVGNGLEDSEGENGEKGITAKLLKDKILQKALID